MGVGETGEKEQEVELYPGGKNAQNVYLEREVQNHNKSRDGGRIRLSMRC